MRVFSKKKFRVDKLIFIVNNKGTAVADSDSGSNAAVCRQSLKFRKISATVSRRNVLFWKRKSKAVVFVAQNPNLTVGRGLNEGKKVDYLR